MAEGRQRWRAVGKLGAACVAAGVVAAAMLAPVGVGAGVLSNQVNDAVGTIVAGSDDNQLTRAQVPLTTTVLDRTGAPIATLYDQYRLPVTYDGIAKTMDAAIIAIEDRRFFAEAGVDPRAVLRAAVNNSSGGSTQGASTITQQYVKNYLINVIDRTDPAAQRADRADTISRKVREAELALQLGHSVPKEQILAGYLNVVEFSGSVYGVAAAAHAYFGTTPDKLTVPQAALLAGMVNNPNLYNPYTHPQQAAARRDTVLDAMVATGSITPAAAATAKAAPLGVVAGGPAAPGSTCFAAAPDAGFFCDYAVRYLEQSGFTADQLATGGYTIKTTMDPVVSQTVKDAVDRNVPTAQDGVANTFAVVAPGHGGDSGGHDVLAMVANRNLGTEAAKGERSTNIVADPSNVFGAGSSFKIFTTAAALEQGTVGYDSDLPNPGSGCFTPPNTNRYTHCYPVANDGDYADPISLPDAPATSPNAAGGDPVTDAADPLSRNPQYNKPQSQYFQGLLSFTLGVSPVSPLEMANVTATVLSDGVWCPPNPIQSVTDSAGRPVAVAQQPCEQVVNPGLAHTLAAGLAKDTTDGTSAAAAGAAGWHRPDIGKTGTTNESESVAFIGGVDGYAAASMVYADSSHPQEICPGHPVHLGTCGHGAFGGTVAAPPYFAAFNQLLAGKPDVPVPGPDDAYRAEGDRLPVVPYGVGQAGPAAAQAVTAAGYPAQLQAIPSPLPQGQVVGESPQGNRAPGTPVTLWTSAGR